MGRNFVAQVARFAGFGGAHLIAQSSHFGNQGVDLLLLAKYGAVEFIEQIFVVADLDLDLVEAVFQGALSGFVAIQRPIRCRALVAMVSPAFVKQWQRRANQGQDAESEDDPAGVHGNSRLSANGFYRSGRVLAVLSISRGEPGRRIVGNGDKWRNRPRVEILKKRC